MAVVGNPKPQSQTLQAARSLAEALNGLLPTSGDPLVVDLAPISKGLLVPWQLSTGAQEAHDAARSAALLVIATPTYKASFTGLLKLFLDTFAADSLSRTVVVPLVVSGGPAHRHLADLQLRPVLSELGAVAPAQSFLLEQSELSRVDDLARTYAQDHGPLLAATSVSLRS